MDARMRLGLLGVLLLSLAGCATTEFCASCCKWPAPITAMPHGDVRQVMALWADGLVVQADPFHNGMPTPGFSGRIYLYGKDQMEPFCADGTLMVQLFDTTIARSEAQAPLEVWNLDEANLERLLKRDTLGWGYSLWIPWTTYNPEIRKVSLIVKYQPKKGIPAFSGPTMLAVNDGTSVRPPSDLEIHTHSRGPEVRHVRDREPGFRASTIAVPRDSSLSRIVQQPAVSNEVRSEPRP